MPEICPEQKQWAKIMEIIHSYHLKEISCPAFQGELLIIRSKTMEKMTEYYFIGIV
jgi:hypothetical protein